MLSEDDEDNILYELLVHLEWSLEPELMVGSPQSQGGSIFYRMLTQTPSNVLSLASCIRGIVWSNNSVFNSLARIIDNGADWQLGVGAQGAVIVILQGSSLEIRAKKDEYASVVGRNANLYADPFPKWRKVSWSSECSMVAVAYSDGTVEIFNTVGASLFMIYPKWYNEGKKQDDVIHASAALIFSDVRTQNLKWAAELILIDFCGNVRSYFVSPTEGYQESYIFSFSRLYPHGITAAVDIGSLIFVAGDCKYISDPSLKNNGLGHGLSIWRMVIDYPYYKQVPTIDEDDYIPPRISPFQFSPLKETANYDCIFRLCVSPLGRQVAALHASGSISIWDIPSLRKRKFWVLQDQPGYDIRSSLFAKSSKRIKMVDSDLSSHIFDVKWWCEGAVILARFSGAVTVCSVSSLTNLLGESPEFFEGVPQISEANDLSFLGLETERQVLKNGSRNMSEVLPEQVNEGHQASDSDGDDEEELSYYQRSKRLVKSSLYWITDAERFQSNKSNCAKLVSTTCRLLSLKSTTPHELFSRKIESEEYGEALALANRYNLDCDLVYQQQWRRNDVTCVTIQDYLHKIKKRWWVLDECLERVPQDIDAARDLLLFGLKGTELDTLVSINNEDDLGEFIVSDLALDYEDDFDSPDAEIRAEEWAAEDLRKRTALLSQIDFENLSGEQRRVIDARQKLLQYYDRLCSYEVLLGGPHVAPDKYDHEFYKKFRGMSETEAAVDFARNYNWKGVEVMLTYHGTQTLPHRLAILSNFPSTMAPFEYRYVLPECDLNGVVFEWEEEVLRDVDWCEDPICRQDPDSEAEGLEDLYRSSSYLKEFRNVELTGDVVSKWYKCRTREIESSSHFIDAALDLLKLGTDRNVANLDELQDSFESLEVLIYEVGLSDLSFQAFDSLDMLQKLQLFMSSSNVENHVQNLRNFGLPFLNNCNKKSPGIGNELLKEYIVNASKDDLYLLLKVIQNSHPEDADPIMKGAEEMLSVVLDAVYNCEKETQLPRAFAVVGHLPPHQSSDCRERMRQLQDEIDALEDHLMAAEILSNYGVMVTCSFIKSIQEDKDKISSLFMKLARTAARREKRLSEEEWRKLLNDMLELQSKVFSGIEPSLCYEVVAEAMLTSGCREYIYAARSFLETRADGSPVHNPYLRQVPYSRSVLLVVKASQEYFNASESFQDLEMELARFCLDIIESENDDIDRERDLISSLHILPVIGIKKLPLQVRLCEDRLTLIEESLSRHPENYHLGSRILQLAHLLRVCDDDSLLLQARVLSLLAEAALKSGDETYASKWCEALVSGGHSRGWKMCAKLGRCATFANLKLRAKFLDFALTHAESAFLEDLLRARNEVELLILYSKVQHQFEVDDLSPDSDDGFEDANSFPAAADESEEWLDPEGENYTSSAALGIPHLQATKNFFSSSTNSIVSSVSSKKFWRNAIGWMRPLQQKSRRGQVDKHSGCESATLDGQGCHAFYFNSSSPDTHISALSPSYKSYAPPILSSSSLEYSLNLFRVALVEETLTLGETRQNNTTVIQELAKSVLHEDLGLGISLLQKLNSAEAHQVFSYYPTTEASLQVSLYYFALRIYSQLHPWEERNIAPVFLHKPADVIDYVSKTLQNDVSAQNNVSIKNDKEYFNKIETLAIDYVQGQTLQSLGAGVDIERFLSDANYKEDTVLGLAMSTVLDVFDLAVSLAKKYDVSSWHVYMTHLQFLFDSCSANDLESIVIERQIMKILSQKPTEFVSFMQQNIFFTINGKDYDMLRLYYSLLSSVSEDDFSIDAASHINFLQKLNLVHVNLNYKDLLRGDDDIVDLLRPVLSASNVSVLADLASGLSGMGCGALDSSKVYCAWAQKHFFDATSKQKPKTTSEWLKMFNLSKDTMHKMCSCDFETFIRRLTLSKEAFENIPPESRRELARRAITMCDSFSKSKDNDSWTDVSGRLQKLAIHLELLQTETFQNLLNSSPAMKNYALQFAACGGDETSLESLSRKVLLELSSLETLRSLLSVYPEDVLLFPEDVFTKVLQEILETWEDDVKDPNPNSFLQILQHLLEELRLYIDEGGELLWEEEVLGEIRSFFEDPSRSHEARITVLKSASRYLALSDDDLRLLQILETGDIVERAWAQYAVRDASNESSPTDSTSVSLDSESIKTEGGRKEIFELLLSNICNVSQGESLLELLKIWPKFEVEMYDDPSSNPWIRAYFKTLDVAKPEEHHCLNLLPEFNQAEITPTCSLSIVERILSSTHAGRVKVAAKISFRSRNESAIEAVLEELKTATLHDEDYDYELLGLIVSEESVPMVVSTALYGPLVNFLMESQDSNLLSSAKLQLENSDRKLEAGSLLALNSATPKGLRTISACLSYLKNSLPST